MLWLVEEAGGWSQSGGEAAIQYKVLLLQQPEAAPCGRTAAALLTFLSFLLPVCFRCNPGSIGPASGGFGEPGAGHTPGTGGLLWL